ncbi:MAG: 4-hydroxybutyrate CoA-transferase [Clostridiales Family XIII bacterium]|jgi:4-hydroxybutyrate CoA-transferase|nr:4-hydroxybutyrate CoA-transferase [Clostridiales Family XIII bacterium]
MKDYQSIVVSAEEAVKRIPKDANVWLGHISEPKALVAAMVANKEAYDRVKVWHLLRLGPEDITLPGNERYFLDKIIFAGGNARRALAAGTADFVPGYFHDVPKLVREGKYPCDVSMVQVSTPDENGYVSLGVNVDFGVQIVRTAKIAIAQINGKLPRTFGDGLLHISEFDYLVFADDDLDEIQPPAIGDVEKAIGEHCAGLIEDGSTLQLGIGGIPDAVMLFLGHKKDLGIHSEMISDGTLDLYEKGAITGALKSENVGKMIVTFVMGTKRVYDFVDNNPLVEFRTVDYVNHPVIIMRQRKMVCVNAAMEVDLQGQVCAESIGLWQFSGVGGQVDFVRGASMSDGGKSIITLPSVAVKKDGTKISKIVPFLTHGAPVTTSRVDVDYVITEYGIAEMKGKSLRERAQNLTAIAHPDFRDELTEEAARRFAEFL